MEKEDFRKTHSCPSSDELLAFASSEFRSEDSSVIEDHLVDCDFCSMEAEMYSRFPQSAETVETPLIPRALYELARMLLPIGSEIDTDVIRGFGDDGELELGQPCGAF